MFSPGVSRNERWKFYFYTFIFQKKNGANTYVQCVVYLYTLFLTVTKSSFFASAHGEMWRVGGCTFGYRLAYLKSELEMFVPPSEHSHLEISQAHSICFWCMFPLLLVCV